MARRRVTITDVATHAGVSKTSVSRALNGKGEQHPDTAARILNVMDELGYVPASTARSLARGQAGSIGVLVPSSMWWEWTVQVIRGVVETVEAAGYTVTLSTTEADECSHDELARRIIKARAVDGVVAILPAGMLDYLERIDAEGMPVVLVDESEHRPAFPSVRVDNLGGATEAVRHLIQSTSGKVGHIAGPADLPVRNERLDGYRAALREAGIPFDETLIRDGESSSASGEAAAEALIAAHPDICGLFCATDHLAIGALRAVRRSGREIPKDVAIVGFDDLEIATESDPPLTTIRQPRVEIGVEAAQMILDLLSGQAPPHEIVLPTSLIMRETTVTSPQQETVNARTDT